MAELGPRLQAALEGRYEIEREIGRGGMAIVFLANDLRHQRAVAIKVLKPDIATSIGAERFLREIETAARLTHPYILPLYDSGEADGLLYYVMPFVEGETLRARLERERQLPIEEAITITQDVAAALAHAHSLGIIHRDIKPENIMLEGGEAVVTDFGVARALDTAGADRLTETGLTLGTLAYMSPEQAGGDRKLDGRSDEYALACTLFEMLTGEQPFTGPTAQSIIAKHISEQPPSIHVVRPTVPPAVEEAVRKGLAKIPADRFPSVLAFAEALTAERASTAVPIPAVPETHWKRRRWWLVAAPAALAIAALVVFGPRLFGGNLNPSQYVLATMGPDPNSQIALRWEIELASALAQLPNVVLTEDHRVNDRILQMGGTPPAIDGWLGLAEGLGAGRLLVSRLVAAGDSTEVLADEYDVRRGRAVNSQRARVSEASMAAGAARLVERLFNMRTGIIGNVGSSNPEAVRAYVAGHEALKSWDLARAAQYFDEAIRADPANAQAHLWLAKVQLWAGKPIETWQASARRAAGSASELRDQRERDQAVALRALAESQFPDACRRFAALIAADSQSFENWFGLGECHRRDRIVVPDAQSASGWRFRSSFHTAVQAYQRALEQVPSFAFQFGPFERLNDVLIVNRSQLRAGYQESSPTALLAAFPALVHDTIGYTPYPLADIQAGLPGTTPATHRQAIAKNQERLLQIVRSWTAAFPDSARANLALAQALELNEWLDGSADVERSALAAARKARRTSRTTRDSLEAGLLEARLLLKLERFEEVSRVAQELLGDTERLAPDEARQLVGLAALSGRPALAASLARRGARVLAESPGGPYGAIPLPVLETWQAFMSYASVGAPEDSVKVYAARLDTVLQAYPIPSGQAAFVTCQISWYPRSLAFGILRQVTDDRRCWESNGLLEMQWALAANRPDLLRSVHQDLERGRTDLIQGEVSFEHHYGETQLRLELGDTATALAYLSRALSAFTALRSSVLSEAPQAASLVRAMALRAELARAAGDQATARLWAARVQALWRNGEPAVESIRARMRELAGS